MLVYSNGGVALYLGDCRVLLAEEPDLGLVDAVVTDPPYGQTSLEWDQYPTGWTKAIASCPSMWVFGTLRMFTAHWDDFADWKFSQDIVWEKHNGSSFHADRFRRVHEQAAHFYRGQWSAVYKSPVYTLDATPRTARRKGRPSHMGHIDATPYQSFDGGPRLQRSVIQVRSTHGTAVHPTQKPIDILTPLITYSCPPGGIVLDPFAGSGSTLLAARAAGRFAIGIEANPDYCAAAIARLEGGD